MCLFWTARLLNDDDCCSALCHLHYSSSSHLTLSSLATAIMKHFCAELKQHILTQYASQPSSHSFSSLAATIEGGISPSTVRNWYHQWDGTQQSLVHKKGAGRPRLLNKAQVNSYIRTPIRNKNRSHHAASYTQLLPSVQQKTGVDVSLRSLRRYGKRDLHVKMIHTKKRTADESKLLYASCCCV